MGSPLDLLVDGQKVARINHQETVELNLIPDNRLSVRIFHPKKQKKLRCLILTRRNSIRNKNESATDFFLCAVLYWSVSNDRVLTRSGQLSIILSGIFLYLAGYLCLGLYYSKQAYVIEEVTNG